MTVDIPRDALYAAEAEADVTRGCLGPATTSRMLAAVAPLIVAAHLRRMAADCQRGADAAPPSAVVTPDSLIDHVRVGLLHDRAAYLRAAADEMDRGAS